MIVQRPFNDNGLQHVLHNCKIYRTYLYAQCRNTSGWYIVKKVGSEIVYQHGYQNTFKNEMSVLHVIDRILAR